MIFSENRCPPRIKCGAGFFRDHALDRRKDFLIGADALQRKRPERAGGNAACFDKIRRQQQLAGKLPAHRFDARGQIDRRPDHGEVEPGVAADIAIHDIADVQREAVVDPWTARAFAAPILIGAYHLFIGRAHGPAQVVRGIIVVSWMFLVPNVMFALIYTGAV